MTSDNVVPLPVAGPFEARGAAADDLVVPELDPELRAMFAKLDALMDGLTREEQLQAAWHLYFDSEGNPQIRSLRVRAVSEPNSSRQELGDH